MGKSKKLNNKSSKKPDGCDKALLSQFEQVAQIILSGREKAFNRVDSVYVETCWKVGAYISRKVRSAQWGAAVVDNLALYLSRSIPDSKGFNRRGLYRMKQFFETYESDKKVSSLLTQIGWTNHLTILSKSRTVEEREFYLKLCAKEKYSSRELERQFASSLFERAVTGKAKITSSLEETHPLAPALLRDVYSLDFLGLPSGHSEYDLRKAIVADLKSFIIEFGRDFAFVGEEYRLQVGMKDFHVDLLFFHREHQCLVAFELKIDDFRQEYLGKMDFYLEALDRDVKKAHENPSIGIILCKGKDDEVVEYALSRTLSSSAVAEYTTKLPDKRLLEEKLHEFFDLSVREMGIQYESSSPELS
jgi:predicted nuclease of restriction endonuclease-like (RecB) superfamily